MTHWKDRRDASSSFRPLSHSHCAGLLPIGTAIKVPAVVGNELIGETCTHAVGAEATKIEVEVGMHRHELADIDALMAFAQPFGGSQTGGIVVAGDIKPAQRRGQVEGGAMMVWPGSPAIIGNDGSTG